MTRRIENITDEANQRHIVLFEGSEITLNLRFYPTVEMWAMSLSYQDRQVNGVKLSLGTVHILSQNLPFDFAVVDRSGNGMDPFRRDDFSEGRCRLYLLDFEEVTKIRGGAEVPL